MKGFFKNNSLSIVVFMFFILFLAGQSVAGFRQHNEALQTHGDPAVSYQEYLGSGDFIEGVFENWESEFLQMGAYVILTAYLIQRGSAESKRLENEQKAVAQTAIGKTPWPIRRGGWILKLYQNSLSIAFLLLFAISFGLHAYGGARATCQENLRHAEIHCEGVWDYMGTSKFWYESLQNWQSEFLAVFSIVVLSIFLRQKNSPESKPLESPHQQTGA